MSECKHVAEMIGPYLFGHLSVGARATVDAHLASCQGCRREVVERHRALAALGAEKPTQAERERILRAVRAETLLASYSRVTIAWGLRRVLTMGGLALVACGLFLSGIWVGERRHATRPSLRVVGDTPKSGVRPAPVVVTDTRAASAQPRLRVGDHPPKQVASPSRTRFRQEPYQLVIRHPTRVVAPLPCGVDDVGLATVDE